MDRTERFYRIDGLLQANFVVPIKRMLDELEVSRATFKRDIEYMRDRLNAPIVWDRDERGYRYEKTPAGGKQSLPGLWFNSSEAYALLMMQKLLSDMQPGLLGTHVAPLQARLKALIESGQHAATDVEQRIRLLTTASRPVADKNFEVVATALLRRQRLEIEYYGRGRDESTVRAISPQLLIHYRGNWYVAAWCHLRNDLRSFALDAIEQSTLLSQPAKEVDKRQMDGFLGQGYGIFSGSKLKWAKLRFSAERARWVSSERWHPQQRTFVDRDGQLILEVPYADQRELSMDILRHGRHVEVLDPPELCDAIKDEIKEMARLYSFIR